MEVGRGLWARRKQGTGDGWGVESLLLQSVPENCWRVIRKGSLDVLPGYATSCLGSFSLKVTLHEQHYFFQRFERPLLVGCPKGQRFWLEMLRAAT